MALAPDWTECQSCCSDWRTVDENDLVTGLDEAPPLSKQPINTGNILESDDISSLFGLDIEEAEGVPAANGATSDMSKPALQTGRKRPNKKSMGHKTAVTHEPKANAPIENTDISQQSTVPHASSKKQSSKSRGSGKAKRRQPSDNLSPRKTSRKARSAGTRKAGELGIELTPDGFVKWWK